MEMPHRSSMSGSGDSAPRSAANWLDPAPYKELTSVDRAGLMWEWLRRNPEYRAASGQTKPNVPDIHNVIKILRTFDVGLINPWGLHFCRGGRYRRKLCGDYVAGRI